MTYSYEDNAIGESGTVALANALKVNSTLHQLHLTGRFRRFESIPSLKKKDAVRVVFLYSVSCLCFGRWKV